MVLVSAPFKNSASLAQDREDLGVPQLLKFDRLTTLHYAILEKVRKKYPNSIDEEIVSELNRFLAMPSLGFKKQRTSRHILKIAYSHYLILRGLARLNKLFPEKKHLELRVIKQQLIFPFGKKAVLGIALGVNLEERYELLSENHILQSALAHLPGVSIVQRSFYSCRDSHEDILLIYIELMKVDGSDFSPQEIAVLKKNLPQELESRIEKLSPTLFTTLNEEEILKSILILSRELRGINDRPEVMIFFDKQAKGRLVFSAIVVRILKKEVKDWNAASFEGIQCEQRRSQIVGYLLRKHPKEAVILKLSFPVDPSFLRKDSSINLYLARQKVASFIASQFGEFRDYNGGIILTRLDLLSKLKEQVPTPYLDFVEHLFHAITPLEMQAILSLKTAKTLINLFLEGLTTRPSSKKEYILKTHEESQRLFVVVQSTNLELRNHLQKILKEVLSSLSTSLISTSIYFEGIYHLGLIYPEACLEKQQAFLQTIQGEIHSWKEKFKGQSILRLSVLNLPLSLDPRLGGDDISRIVLRMLYEGLMRIGQNDLPVGGIAERFTLSSDLKRYTFFLREADWSNGKKITAHDFEYAWKKVLSPTFKTSFSYLFDAIKNAQLAKNGTLPIDAVGVKALNETCLQVDLEEPNCRFLELTTHPLYSPVYHLIDIHPDWASLSGASYVCNGPFYLHNQSPGHGYELRKNEKYWDKNHVKLDKIFIFKSSSYTAIDLYRKNEIDWIGRPLSPWEPFFTSNQLNKSTPFFSSFIYWCICNTLSFPLNHPKIRQALCYAIDRQAIIDALSYDAFPATTPLPLIHTLNADNGLMMDRGKEKAQQLLKEALEELGLQVHQLPVLNFIYYNREIKVRIVEYIQEQWKKTLGIQCATKGYELKPLLLKMAQGDYHLGGIGWDSPINHPLYILDIFRNASHSFNFSKWENKRYQQLLVEATKEEDPPKQLALLAQAEKILIQELPVIPIFYEIDKFEKKDHLKGVYYSKTGIVDFKSAYIEQTS